MSHDASSPFSDDAHYRRLRDRLIRFFDARGSRCGADLADDTLMRVLETHSTLPAGCSVDQWTFGIARNVLRESHRHSWRMVSLDPASPPAALQYAPANASLELEMLPLEPAERALLYAYYLERNLARVLAGRSGTSEVAIRGRAHRVIKRVRLRLRIGGRPAASGRAA